MRLSVLWIMCFACGGVYVDKEGGKTAQIYTLVKPGPVHNPWEIFTPTPPIEHCGVACQSGLKEPAAAAAEPIQPALAETETVACAGVSPARRTTSPFANRDAIQKIQPIKNQNQLVGVRVVFKPDRSLDVDTMERHIMCRRAIYSEVGAVAVGQTGDPTLLPGSDVLVDTRGNNVVVTVTSQDPDEAQLVLARARSELPTQTARR